MLSDKKIFIEDGDGIGDLLMVTPTLRTIKRLYPTAQLTFATFGKCIDVVKRLSYIDKSYGINNGLIGRVESTAYLMGQDYVFFRSYQPTLIRVAYGLRIPHRAGICKPKNYKSGLWTVPFLASRDWDSREYMAEYIHKQTQKALGVALPIEPDDYHCDVSQPNESEVEHAHEILRSAGKDMTRPYALISPFGNTGIDLSREIITAALNYLVNTHDMDCVLVNQKKLDMPLGDRVYDIGGQTSLMELVALAQEAKCALTVDTGVMHILGAVGVPMVAIFTSDLPQIWAPRKNCWAVSVELKCKPCTIRKDCPEPKCLRDLRIEDILSAIDRMIGSLVK